MEVEWEVKQQVVWNQIPEWNSFRMVPAVVFSFELEGMDTCFDQETRWVSFTPLQACRADGYLGEFVFLERCIS